MSNRKLAQADEVGILVARYLDRICAAREIERGTALAGAHGHLMALMVQHLGARQVAAELRRAADDVDFFAMQAERATTTATGHA